METPITEFTSAEEVLLHLAKGLSIINNTNTKYTLCAGKLYSVELGQEVPVESCITFNALLRVPLVKPYQAEWYETTPFTSFKPRLCWVFSIRQNVSLLRYIKTVEQLNGFVYFYDDDDRIFVNDLFRVKPLTKEEITILFTNNLES